MRSEPGSGGLELSGEHGIFQGTMKHNLGGHDICRLLKALGQPVFRVCEVIGELCVNLTSFCRLEYRGCRKADQKPYSECGEGEALPLCLCSRSPS